MEEGDLDMLPHNLRLPQDSNIKTKYFSFCELERQKGVKEISYDGDNITQSKGQDYNHYFKDICLKSLYVKAEAVKAIQEIQGYCEDVQKHTFFQTKIDHRCRLEEFKNSQDLHIQYNTFSSLKLNWPN